MSAHLKVGDKIPLTAHLECPEGTTFYVEAIVKKPDRTAYSGSPVDLTDEGEGLFIDESLLMPDLPYLTVTYKVYEDAGKTTESDEYCQVTELFHREEADTSNQENLASIELELDLSVPSLSIDFSSILMSMDISKPSLELESESIGAVMELKKSTIGLDIDPISLELNLECCI